MTTKRKQPLKEKPLVVDDDVDGLRAEVARLRGALRLVLRLAATNLKLTPEYMTRDRE